MTDLISTTSLAAIDWKDLIQVLVALIVVGGGALGGLLTNRKESQTAKKQEPTETQAPPRRVPQHPTAQPMPIPRVEFPPHSQLPPLERSVPRPTAPPVVAEFPAPMIRRKPVPQPSAPAHRSQSSDQVKKPKIATEAQRRIASQVSVSETSKRAGKRSQADQITRSARRLDPSIAQQAPEPVQEVSASTSLRDSLRLNAAQTWRRAIVMSEILAPPLALRPGDDRF